MRKWALGKSTGYGVGGGFMTSEGETLKKEPLPLSIIVREAGTGFMWFVAQVLHSVTVFPVEYTMIKC